jgi:hypothetical protein
MKPLKKFILLFFILITACNSFTKQETILEKSNCDLPCWNGITPGKTTEDQLLQILGNPSSVDQNSIRNENQPWNIFDNQIFFSLNQVSVLAKETKIQVYLTHEIVSDMNICGDLQISMGDIVDQVSEPKSIFSNNNIAGDRTIVLVDPNSGIAYWYSTDPKLKESQYEINPETKIGCLGIFDPNLYEKMLDAKRFSNGIYDREETLKAQYPWNGYGNLNEKYPPR